MQFEELYTHLKFINESKKMMELGDDLLFRSMSTDELFNLINRDVLVLNNAFNNNDFEEFRRILKLHLPDNYVYYKSFYRSFGNVPIDKTAIVIFDRNILQNLKDSKLVGFVAADRFKPNPYFLKQRDRHFNRLEKIGITKDKILNGDIPRHIHIPTDRFESEERLLSKQAAYEFPKGFVRKKLIKGVVINSTNHPENYALRYLCYTNNIPCYLGNPSTQDDFSDIKIMITKLRDDKLTKSDSKQDKILDNFWMAHTKKFINKDKSINEPSWYKNYESSIGPWSSLSDERKISIIRNNLYDTIDRLSYKNDKTKNNKDIISHFSKPKTKSQYYKNNILALKKRIAELESKEQLNNTELKELDILKSYV